MSSEKLTVTEAGGAHSREEVNATERTGEDDGTQERRRLTTEQAFRIKRMHSDSFVSRSRVTHA